MKKKAKFYFLALTAFCSLHAQAAVRYVNLNNASPAAPFASWATAATNIQDAIDAAGPGDQVLVRNGVYQSGGHVVYGALTNRVAVNKPLTVQSINGPAVTVIQGYQVPGTTNDNGAIRCVYLTNDAVLVGFTLTNGATLWNQSEASDYGVFSGGGVFCESVSAVVSNCVITHCSASDSGGGAAGGTLNNCILTANFGGIGGGIGGGAGGAILNKCKIFDNSTTQNGGGGGVGYCTANNCLIYHNSAGAGGGAYSSTLNNCTLFKNSAYNGGGSYNGGFQTDSPLNNCIVSGNTASNSGDNYAGFYGAVLNCCCTTPLPSGGAGNFTNAPLFVNPAGGDFHLQSNSPCINSGNNSYVVGTNDLDGLPRVTGGTVDIGAYEFQTPASILSYAWAQQYGLPTDGLADSADPDGDGMNNWAESRARTNPTNALSVLKMLSPMATNNSAGITVTWQSVAGVVYFLDRSASLAAQPPFSTIQSNLTGQAGETAWLDDTATNRGPFFYRIGVQ